MISRTWVIDTDDTLCLGNGWHAVGATCDCCGDRIMLLLNPNGGGLDTTPPPHERTGPLPARVLAAIDQPRCGGRRRNGRRCRAPVLRPGDRCHWHRSILRRSSTLAYPDDDQTDSEAT